MNSRSTCHF